MVAAKIMLIVVILILGIVGVQWIFKDVLYGPAKVVSGEQLRIGDETITLRAIVAPPISSRCEFRSKVWPCGELSAASLSSSIGQSSVWCRTEAHGPNMRDGKCYVVFRDIASKQVESGWAAVRNGAQEYLVEQRKAQSDRVGLWGVRFVAP